MAAVNFYGLTGTLAVAIDPSTTVIQVNAALAGALSANMNIGDYTFLSISAGGVYELVKVTGVSNTLLTVERGTYTTSRSFPAGAAMAFELTADAILDSLVVPPNIASISGTGQITVSSPSPNVFELDVPTPTITGEGVDVLGTWPNLQIALQPKDCCGGEGGELTSGIVSLQGIGIIQAYATGTEGYVNLPAPNFVGVGITITGSWPDFTFTVASGAGGTVTSVAAGPGLTITGSPTVTPTVNMSNTGVVAGTYGGIAINARGQITAVPATLNPVSIINFNAPLSGLRLADAVTISVADAAIGVKGVVELVDPADPYDPLEDELVLTPAALATALATLEVSSLAGADSFSSEADASYTNAVTATATALLLASGKKALIIAHGTVLATPDPTVAFDWGIAVFNATSVKVKANKSHEQKTQYIVFEMTGPVDTILTLFTTDLTGASLASYGLHILKV